MQVIIRQSTYAYDDLRPRFFGIMDALGGAGIRPGSRVLIKPNLLLSAKPEDAIVTHPLVVKAAVEYVLERQALPVVSDSPAMASVEKVLRESGIRQALAGLAVVCRPFEASVKVDIGPPFGAIDLAQDVLEADYVINLPKLKTHGQMLMTLGIKNLFGCVVGYRKPEWHMRAGVDRDMFARLLVLIARRIRPAFTVLDGILALEGDGPGKGGTPRNVGVLMGSKDPAAVDWAACLILGLDLHQVPTMKIAEEMGWLSDPLEIDGTWVPVKGFNFPDLEPIVFGPKIFQRLSRQYLLQRPVPDMNTCKLCGECVKICPAKAIIRDNTELRFDYDVCIRCYCCLEICPYGAIHKKDNRVARLVRTIAGRIL